MGLNLERLAWWVFWIAFAFLVALLLFGLTFIFLKATSIEFSYLLGFFSFLLLANRLLFGYGWIVYFLEQMEKLSLDQQVCIQRLTDRISQRTYYPEEHLKGLSIKGLIMILFKEYDYYRYTYYGLFILLMVFTLLAKFNLLGEFVIGKYVEGVFWGAATVSFFVWGLEQLARVSFIQFAKKIT
ncbi:MAG: hypothetical protein GXO45_00080 [Aquificae bacterium]|nr:hypothetical protein [Aquificota bacterium]